MGISRTSHLRLQASGDQGLTACLQHCPADTRATFSLEASGGNMTEALVDIRNCDFSNLDLSGKVLSGVLMQVRILESDPQGGPTMLGMLCAGLFPRCKGGPYSTCHGDSKPFCMPGVMQLC
mgnify:CR=1 FL=1